MRLIALVRIMALIALLAGVSAANIKYIAIVEGDIDEGSGASGQISRADVRLVTAEIRREAVKNLPPKKYVIMTSETVIAQGGAVLEECAEENCVISLGSKIGADFIVRGTVSKLESRFTLQVEMYETNDGTLVASCDPVRSESIGELVEKAGTVCADMFTRWLATQKATVDPDSKRASKISVGAGALFAGDFGGGAVYDRGQIGMPFYGGGAYLTFDATYAAVSVGYSQGGGKWKGPDSLQDSLPDAPRSSLNIGVYAKYPNVGVGKNITLYPVLSIDYEIAVSGKLEYADGRKYVFDDRNEDRYTASALSALWVKIGGGADYFVTKSGVFIRAEALYGARTANMYEKDAVGKHDAVDTRLGHGLTVRAGAGFKL